MLKSKKTNLEEDTNLFKLEQLTKKLIPYSHLVKIARNDYVEIKATNGYIIGLILFQDDNVCITKFMLTSGCSYEEHYHNNIFESLTVLEGQTTVFVDGKKNILNKLENLLILPNVPHYGSVVGNTIILSVTSPPETNFVDKGVV